MKDKTCLLPWIHMATTPDGQIKPCCLYEEKFPTNLSEFWNSESMQSIREGHLRGEEISGCEKCWRLERAGIKSKRQTDNKRFKHLKNRIKGQIVKSPPAYLDIKLSNLCNLKCRICGIDNSSTWAVSEFKRLKNTTSEEMIRVRTALNSRKWLEGNNDFWDYLDSISEKIEFFDFTGGEPFMVPEHWDFLKACVDRGIASNISLHYNTNATIFPEDFILWESFNSVEVMCSIDDIGNRFEYQRHPAKWDIVEKNIKAFRDLNFIKTSICTTVNILNLYYLPELIRWAKKEEIFYHWFNILHGPSYFNIKSLPLKDKRKVARKLKRIPELESILNFMYSEDLSENYKFFFYNIEMQDKIRNESYQKTFPEFWKILNEPEWKELFI